MVEHVLDVGGRFVAPPEVEDGLHDVTTDEHLVQHSKLTIQHIEESLAQSHIVTDKGEEGAVAKDH